MKKTISIALAIVLSLLLISFSASAKNDTQAFQNNNIQTGAIAVAESTVSIDLEPSTIFICALFVLICAAILIFIRTQKNPVISENKKPKQEHEQNQVEKESNTANIIIRVCALILMFIFFMPTVLVSCQGESEEISAFDISIGEIGENPDDIEELMGEIDAKPQVFAILLLAVIIFIICKKHQLFTAFLGLCNIASLILLYNYIRNQVEEAFDGLAVTETTFWFVLYIIVACIIIAAAIVSKYSNRIFKFLTKTDDSIEPPHRIT